MKAVGLLSFPFLWCFLTPKQPLEEAKGETRPPEGQTWGEGKALQQEGLKRAQKLACGGISSHFLLLAGELKG